MIDLIAQLHRWAELSSMGQIEYDCLLISVDRISQSIVADRHIVVGAETGAKHLFELAGP